MLMICSHCGKTYEAKPDEVDAAKKVVEELLSEGCINKINYYSKLNSLDLNCMNYGFSVYIRDLGSI